MIVLIDNYDSFTYNLYHLCAKIYPEVRIIRNDQITLNELSELKPRAMIISPGPGTPEKAGMIIPIIQEFSGKIPILGVCLGHQAIAAAFGGKIIQAHQILHGKESLILHSEKHIFSKLKNPIVVGRYHSLVVEKATLPSHLVVEAKTKEGTIMAIRHQSHCTHGIQFHPESILTEAGTMMLQNFFKLAITDKIFPKR